MGRPRSVAHWVTRLAVATACLLGASAGPVGAADSSSSPSGSPPIDASPTLPVTRGVHWDQLLSGEDLASILGREFADGLTQREIYDNGWAMETTNACTPKALACTWVGLGPKDGIGVSVDVLRDMPASGECGTDWYCPLYDFATLVAERDEMTEGAPIPVPALGDDAWMFRGRDPLRTANKSFPVFGSILWRQGEIVGDLKLGFQSRTSDWPPQAKAIARESKDQLLALADAIAANWPTAVSPSLYLPMVTDDELSGILGAPTAQLGETCQLPVLFVCVFEGEGGIDLRIRCIDDTWQPTDDPRFVAVADPSIAFPAWALVSETAVALRWVNGNVDGPDLSEQCTIDFSEDAPTVSPEDRQAQLVGLAKLINERTGAPVA